MFPLTGNLRISLCSLLALPALLGAQNYTGPIPMPVSGYGSWGSYAVDSIVFYNSIDPTLDTSVIYFPQGTTSPVPTVLFLHGISGNTSAHSRELFHFIASKGYACVFVPWDNSMPVIQAYGVMYNGFLEAARNNPSIIDTTRIGFLGHSFGGGAAYYLGYYMAQQNWGTNARFLMPVAQWYTHIITQNELQTYPAGTYLLSIIYDDDAVCDHRMTIEAFRNISISPADKDIVLVNSSQYQSYNYDAGHTTMNTITYDAMDCYVTFRLLDAMMDFAFNQNLSAKQVCLGDGSAQQITMPSGLNSLVAGDTLNAWHDEILYGYPCSSMNNPRWNYCDVSLTVQSMLFPAIYVAELNGEILLVNAQIGNEYVVTDIRGAIISEGKTQNKRQPIATAALSPGIYFLRCDDEVIRFVRQ